MSKFKVGDRVRRRYHWNADMDVGDEGVVVAVLDHGFVRVHPDKGGVCDDHDEKNMELIELASPSPVITKTVKEIVRGKYGCVEVSDVAPEGVSIWLPRNARYTADDLTHIINTLAPIRDALADALEA